MMQEANTIMGNLMKLLQCNRRKPEPVKVTHWLGPLASARQRKKASAVDTQYLSDATTVSTEPGDFSNNEFSDHSNYSDGSMCVGSRAPARAPPGLLPPPGLNAPPGLECQWQAPARLNPKAASFTPSRLNAAAASFSPSPGQGFTTTDRPQNAQQLRQSIKMLKGALEEWEANLPVTSCPPAALAAPSASESSALFEALSKLTPEEAATVRSMLDSKLPSDKPAQSLLPPWHRTQSTPQRPFTPFQGARTAPWAPRTNPRPLVPKVEVPEGSDESLSSQLKELAEMDNDRILMVRRINRLGLDSAPPLQNHFAQFGSVERVKVAPTRTKTNATHRIRAAPLGFVVMSKVEEAKAALAFGSEHIINGHGIGVFPFQSHDIESKDAK